MLGQRRRLSRRQVLALLGAGWLRTALVVAAPLDEGASGWAPSALGLAISPDGSTAYIAFSLDDAVLEVDLPGGTTRGYDVSSAGRMLASGKILLTPDGRNLYVCNMGPENILSLDVAEKRVRGTLPIAPSFHDSLASLPDSSKVYAAATNLYEINVADNSFRRLPPGGICFRLLAVSPRDPGVLYAIGERICGGGQGQALIRYRLADGKVLASRDLPGDVWWAGAHGRLILSSQEETGYLGICKFDSDQGQGKMHVLDLDTLEVAGSGEIPYGVTDFVLREDTRKIYTIGFWSGGGSPGRLPVTEWDIPSRSVTRQMTLRECSDLRAIALDPGDNRFAYYTEGDRSELRKIDLASGTQSWSTHLSPVSTIAPYSFATNGWRAFVACPGSRQVFEIDLRTGAAAERKFSFTVSRGIFTSGGLLHSMTRDRITTVDPATGARVREVILPQSFNPICVTAVRDSVAFVDFGPGGMTGNNLVAVDAVTGAVRKIDPLPPIPAGHRIVASPEGNRAYLVIGNMNGQARILIYDTADWSRRAEITAPGPAGWDNGGTSFADGVFDVDNRVAYLLGFMRIFRVHMDTDELLDSIRPADAYDQIGRRNGWSATGLCGIRLAANRRLVAASGDAHCVYIYDLGTKRWLPDLMDARGYFLTDGTASPDGRFFFTANQRSDSVSMFDTLRCRLMRVIDLKQPQRNALLRANVVHAATCRPGAVAPGQAITIFGAGLGPEEAASADLEGSGRAGTLLGGVRVLFDGVPAPLLYAQSTQVNAVAPFALNPGGSVTVTVEREGTPVGTIALETAEAVPGLFTAGGSGMGPAAALDETGRAVTAENPARRGSVVTLTATGLGRTDPQPEDGAAGSGATVAPLAALAATVGGKQAAVESVCGASGQTAGIVLVSVRVPADTAAGEAVPVVLRAGGAASPDGVTLPLI